MELNSVDVPSESLSLLKTVEFLDPSFDFDFISEIQC